MMGLRRGVPVWSEDLGPRSGNAWNFAKLLCPRDSESQVFYEKSL